MRGLIIGAGEVGKAMFEVLSPVHDMQIKDIEYEHISKPIDVMHICVRSSPQLEKIVLQYAKEFSPKIIDVCTTLNPGTTEKIGARCRIPLVHSTTRGLHPNLSESLRTFVKHIGGQEAEFVAKYYREAGINVKTHRSSRTTEAAHILHLVQYGVNLMLADEQAKLCRAWGTDFFSAALEYAKDSNDGYSKLGHESKNRMILTPPGGRIGGHCVVAAANLIPDELRTPFVKMLANYNAEGK